MSLWRSWGFSSAGWRSGARGEYWVLAQAALFIVFVLLPRRPAAALDPEQLTALLSLRVAGVILVLAGLVIAFAAVRALGRSLTPLPYPRDDAALVEHGPFKLVRHPIYSGVIFAAFGLAAFWVSWPHAACAAVLLAFFAGKSRREERWLAARFPTYADYAKRVRHRLIPGIY
jgi:protein-S-isoprenylcysteine O-methyltransferase Ste14